MDTYVLSDRLNGSGCPLCGRPFDTPPDDGIELGKSYYTCSHCGTVLKVTRYPVNPYDEDILSDVNFDRDLDRLAKTERIMDIQDRWLGKPLMGGVRPMFVIR